MTKPKILVISAAGHTGFATVFELLDKGYPVRAFVRNRDARAQALKKKSGAELVFGDLFDFQDPRAALAGVQRAYYCPPLGANPNSTRFIETSPRRITQ